MAKKQDPDAIREKKEQAGWVKKGFKKPNPAKGIPFDASTFSSKPCGGKSEISRKN